MTNKTKKIVTQIIEKELIVVLAVVILLGILFGYSLAAGKNIEPDTFNLRPETENSLLRAGLSDGELN